MTKTPEQKRQDREDMIAYLGISEVAQWEFEDAWYAFAASIPAMLEIQRIQDRMTYAQAHDIWTTFERLIG